MAFPDHQSSPDTSSSSSPSSVNAASIVTVKPWLKDKEKSTKYMIWKEQMICLVESQGLLGFINGEAMRPDDDRLWRRSDRLVKGWMLGSVGEDALLGVASLDTARDVWLDLEKIFSKGSDPHVTLPKQITDAKDCSFYLPLYKAAVKGDWQMAKNFFDKGTYETKAIISHRSETALHIAASTGKSNDFVKELVELMSPDALAIQDVDGFTALHTAARVGNKKAVEILVNKDPNLQYIPDNNGNLPIHVVAIHCHKDVVKYLISKSNQHGKDSPFVGRSGARLLVYVISCHFFDVALDLVDKYPELAISKDQYKVYALEKRTKFNVYALETISKMSSVFPSGESFSWWQKLTYLGIPTEFDKIRMSIMADIENRSLNAEECNLNRFQIMYKASWQKLKVMLWKVILHLVPQAKEIACKKLMHQQALELVKCLCRKLEYLPDKEAADMYSNSILEAAKNGIHEVVELIIDMFPVSVYYTDNDTGLNIFHLAVINRYENIFNLIYQLSDCKHIFDDSIDFKGNNLMHLAARLAPPHKLNLVPGAALQMQRELQWFKEMEKIVTPPRRVWLNYDQKTPKMLFTEEHKKLKAHGEKWMKDTANSCSMAATLIATVVFAAAFTVPGGIESLTGKPIFWGKIPFQLFTISDAISLFTSVTSLLMFLSILTSRYAEEDFLYVLPKRLSIGLLTLFISVTFMMIAFSATLDLVLVNGKSVWLLIPVAALACLPVSCFVLFQFPLLVDVIYSTYGPGIFGKRSDHFLY